MMTIVRNLVGHVPAGVAGHALARLGQQSSAAMSSRSWIVQDNTPFVTSMTPLSRRQVEVSKPPAGVADSPAAGAGTQAVSDRPPAKDPLELRFQLKDGREGLVRRAEAHDQQALAAFMKESGYGAGLRPQADGLGASAVDEHLWMAGAPGHDAFVAVVGGRIVGVGSIDPQNHALASAKNGYFLRLNGMEPRHVCVGHMDVLPEMRGQGIGMALKKAEALAAGRAGYQGVTHGDVNPRVKAIVKKLGGTVEEGSAADWTLLPADAKGVKSE